MENTLINIIKKDYTCKVGLNTKCENLLLKCRETMSKFGNNRLKRCIYKFSLFQETVYRVCKSLRQVCIFNSCTRPLSQIEYLALARINCYKSEHFPKTEANINVRASSGKYAKIV